MSSRIVRNVFDRLRSKGLPAAQLPYNNPEWWDNCYDKLGGQVQEWGESDFRNLIYHDYCNYDESYLVNKLKGSLKKACLADDDLAGPAYSKGENGHLIVLGGGTSNLSRQIHEGGWKNVLDIDFSQKVIDQNREKYGKHFTNLKFECVDARYMRMNILAKTSYAREIFNGQFDVCIDKGVVDGLWCSGKEASKQISLISQSVSSIVKPGGRFLTFSYTSPDLLNPLLLNKSSTPPPQQQASLSNNNRNISSTLNKDDDGQRDANGMLVKSGMWSRLECRKLSSFYMYVLERSEKEFSEFNDIDTSDNDYAKFETWRKTQRNRRK
jgi:2-polyprenyl-3-methyl-5-hydroxy-6-metoxy-1,4-benzoquinol methylase